MIKPIRRNVLLELMESEKEWGQSGLLKPENQIKITNQAKIIAKADDCDLLGPPVGATVVVEFDQEDLEENCFEYGGKKMFLIRESFLMLEVVS